MTLPSSATDPIASIVLNDMDRSDETEYGFRSWLLQRTDRPFEVILNLFNEKTPRFEALREGANANAKVIIRAFPRPVTFNISAANNLGLHTAKGRFVIFANSDVIYPPTFLESVITDMDAHGLSYVNGARVNLSAEQTRALRPAREYSRERGFEFLEGFENLPGRSLNLGLSPWIVSRDAAIAIGGFDSRVICHEDSEFNDRVMHYLRRTGKQNSLYSVADRYGYHVDHPPSELYDASRLAKNILEPRRKRLAGDPSSAEDIVPTPLNDLNALLDDVRTTPAIVPIPVSRTAKVARLLRSVAKRLRIVS